MHISSASEAPPPSISCFSSCFFLSISPSLCFVETLELSRRRSFFALVSRPLCCPQGGPRRFFSSGCATGLLFWQCQLAFPVSACGVKHLFLARGVVYALALAYFECFSVLFPSRPLVLLVVSPSLDSAIFVSRVHDSADRFEPIGENT
ncbi:hypothetical protein F2Q70_00044738 [Brassica cretica]|uniref:Transmembrane protein n=1 Tax=Brassica cretica TaxID=69181 RepID=A0A8S9KHZ4_BRACR|nr:hypothetical protein F2Q70_00044738 [Brassica cretica]